MSSEQDRRDTDKLVGDTYRSLAGERAPQDLNRRVLALAAGTGRSRYSRSGNWIRPMAWAATIGLSLAIVLEVTRLPQTEPESVGITRSGLPGAGESAADTVPPVAETPGGDDTASPAPNAEADRALQEDFAPQDMDVLRKAEGMARTQAGPDTPRADAPGDTAAPRELSAPATEDAAPPASRRSGAVDTGKMRSSARATSSLAASAEDPGLATATACRDEERSSAEAWLGCIDRLRGLEKDDLVEIEMRRFRKIYPDLVETGADR